MTRPLSLAALTVLELSPPEMVSCAAQAGYSHVGLRLVPVMPCDSVPALLGEAPLRREVLARLADTGVQVLDVEFLRIGRHTRAADVLPVLEAGAELGARHVLCAGNDSEETRLAERLAEVCDAAAPLGLTINLEPIPIAGVVDVHTLAQARRVLALAGRSNSGVVVDPIHFDRAGERLEDLAVFPRQWLHYLQFCDAPAERPARTEDLLHQARYQRRIPGEGGLDLAGILRALPAGLPVSVEAPLADLQQRVSAVERARRLARATRALLARVDPPGGAPA
ncbi:MAG: sugar phosphate isomerase/epimerase [Burkholderiales bacterium]|nr:sugar phosphate isomerase/epimerase [Burkholderiales bacterium]